MRVESLDLNEAVADLLKMLGRVIGEHVQLQWHPGAKMGAIHADRGMIEQALMNLCVNARDAMPEGGTLTIETQEVTLDEDFCAIHSWANPGRYAVLSVSDTGCGMPPDILEHIFEPFFTTKEREKGTGLGLATVYGIIKQHNGLIDVSSELHRGTVFRLYWPLSETAQRATPAAVEPPIPGGKETILLAEDDEMVRWLAKRMLEQAGYTVLMAENGEEAVALYQQQGDRIALAVMDVVMPKTSGYEAYTQMLALRPGLRVLFASGYSEKVIPAGILADERLPLIQKPFTRAVLLRAVRETLDRPVQ
jgi:CheY-like chemotaxis protein